MLFLLTNTVLILFIGVLMGFDADAQSFRWNWRANEALENRETISNIRLSYHEKAALQKALETALRRFLGSRSPSQTDLKQMLASFRLRKVDLDHDNVPEIIAQVWDFAAGCSPTGNCPLWIFKGSAAGYTVILKSQGQVFQVLKTARGRYQDFLVGTHGSALERTLLLYRVRDAMYREEACFDATFYVTSSGEQEKTPTVTKCK